MQCACKQLPRRPVLPCYTVSSFKNCIVCHLVALPYIRSPNLDDNMFQNAISQIFKRNDHYLNVYKNSVSRFVGQLLRLLVCINEKFGPQIQKHVKELIGHEMSSALYPILFDQLRAIIDKFFDSQQQVWFSGTLLDNQHMKVHSILL